MAVTSETRYLADMTVHIFNHLMRQTDLGIENRADLLDNEFLVDESGKKVVPGNRPTHE